MGIVKKPMPGLHFQAHPPRAANPKALASKTDFFVPTHVPAWLVKSCPAQPQLAVLLASRHPPIAKPHAPPLATSSPTSLRVDELFACFNDIKKTGGDVATRMATIETLGARLGFDDLILQDTLVQIMMNETENPLIREAAARGLERSKFLEDCLHIFKLSHQDPLLFRKTFRAMRHLISIRARRFDNSLDYLVQTFAAADANTVSRITIADLLVIGHYVGLFDDLPHAYLTGINLYASIVADENVSEEHRLGALNRVSREAKIIDPSVIPMLAEHWQNVYANVNPQSLFAVRLTEETAYHSSLAAEQMLRNRFFDRELTDSTRAFVLERLFVLNHQVAITVAIEALASDKEAPDDQKYFEKKINELVMETENKSLFATWINARDRAKSQRAQFSVGEA